MLFSCAGNQRLGQTMKNTTASHLKVAVPVVAFTLDQQRVVLSVVADLPDRQTMGLITLKAVVNFWICLKKHDLLSSPMKSNIYRYRYLLFSRFEGSRIFDKPCTICWPLFGPFFTHVTVCFYFLFFLIFSFILSLSHFPFFLFSLK
jgi:hypothetical protein